MKHIVKENTDIKIIVHPEYIAVRGNAILSGDAAFDKQVEDSIIKRLENDDLWAWCTVELQVSYKGILTASDYLGCCSYDNEADFKDGCYYDDMIETCLSELNKQVKTLCEC
jgi:hypothetical protein